MSLMRLGMVVLGLGLCAGIVVLGWRVVRLGSSVSAILSMPSTLETPAPEPLLAAVVEPASGLLKPLPGLLVQASRASSAEDQGEGMVSREEFLRPIVRHFLAEAFQKYLPHYDLSSNDYQRLTDAVLRVRAAHRELRRLAVSVENAETLRRLQDELCEALADFEAITDLSMAEFTGMVQSDPGLTEEGDDDVDVVFELLANHPPPQ